jgi:hypothetical protein
MEAHLLSFHTPAMDNTREPVDDVLFVQQNGQKLLRPPFVISPGKVLTVPLGPSISTLEPNDAPTEQLS